MNTTQKQHTMVKVRLTDGKEYDIRPVEWRRRTGKASPCGRCEAGMILRKWGIHTNPNVCARFFPSCLARDNGGESVYYVRVKEKKKTGRKANKDKQQNK